MVKDGGIGKHPWYGPCDAFGPNETCSQCTGLLERIDGSVMNRDGNIVRKRPLRVRLRAAWRELCH